jgi:hypothetical protein
LELSGLYEVAFLYEEKKHYIPSLLKLNKILEREGIHDENDIANILRYANELLNLSKSSSTTKVPKPEVRTTSKS